METLLPPTVGALSTRLAAWQPRALDPAPSRHRRKQPARGAADARATQVADRGHGSNISAIARSMGTRVWIHL